MLYIIKCKPNVFNGYMSSKDKYEIIFEIYRRYDYKKKKSIILNKKYASFAGFRE